METNQESPSAIDQVVKLVVSNHTPEELALGWLRYECLRRMNVRQYMELCEMSLAGKRFDDLVTEALLAWKGPKQ